jgi:hypothetical protein
MSMTMTFISLSASSLSTDNYHETNPDSKEESILINKLEENEAAKKEKEAVKKVVVVLPYLYKFECIFMPNTLFLVL